MLKLFKNSLAKFPTSIYFVTIFLIILLSFVYLIYEVHKQLKISAKEDFIGVASANLISADQSVDELKSSLIAASDSYQNFTQNGKNSQIINYKIAIENNQKNLSQIFAIKNNLDFQKDLIKKVKTPEEYNELKLSFFSYYEKSADLLDFLKEDFNTENEIYTIIDSALGNTDIYKNDHWLNSNTQEIISFYQNLKDGADSALQTMLNLKVSKKYENYYNLHISYLEQLILTSNEVINALKISDAELNSGLPTQLEIAFKAANDSQNEIKNITEKINTERDKYFSHNSTQNSFDKLSKSQQKLESQIKEMYQQLYIEANKNIITF